MIILEPLGGLANRMRVIASGLWLKEKLKTDLAVIWNENYELNCPFNLLFTGPERFAITRKTKKYNYLKTSFQNTWPEKIKQLIVNKLAGVDFCIQEEDFYKHIWPGELNVYDIAKQHNTIYIQTCQEFGDNLSAFRYFKPAPAIDKKIISVVESFTEYTVGVHIRRTDNANSIRFSPTQFFIQKMKAEQARSPNVRFFLCTDDIKEEQAIRAEFGEKIITYQKELDRNTVEGMQDATTELFCLSRTQKIFGSYWSSFSDIAARLNNTKLEVLRYDEKSGLPPNSD